MAISNSGVGIRPGVCTSTTRPVSPYEGQQIYETDTDLTYIWGGSAWQQVSGGTAVGNSGLVYVAEASATSGSSLNVLGCFTSTYDSYKIVISDLRLTAGGITDVNIRTLVGSTVNASNWIFAVQRVDYTAGTNNIYRAASQASMIGAIASSNAIGYEFTISQPQKPQYTTVTMTATDARGSTGYLAISASGQLENTTQYDGLQINVGATFANIKVRVYGFRQA